MPLRFLSLFLPTAAALALMVGTLYVRDVSAARLIGSHDAAQLARLHAEIIAAEFRAVRSDLLFLAEQRSLREFLAAGDAEAKMALAEEFRLFCARKGIYDQIRFLDEKGWERVRVNDQGGAPVIVPDVLLQPKARRYYFARTLPLGSGEIYVSPFDLNVEQDRIEQPPKPVIRFGTPVFDREGHKRGILVLNYLGAGLLGMLEETATGFRGAAMLVNRDGFWLRGPDPAADWAFMNGRERSFAGDHAEAWKTIAAAERGEASTAEGIFAFETAHPSVPRGGSPPWIGATGAAVDDHFVKVIAFLPAAALLERSRSLLGRLLAVSAIALGTLAALAWFLARASATREEALHRLRASEERLHILSQQLLTAQEEERRRVARDLHDDLGQVATALCIDLGRIAQLPDGPRRTEALERARTSAQGVLDRMHAISARLRPALLDDLGLEDAIRSCLGEYAASTGIEVVANLACARRDLPATASENLFRILQEALTNTARHAHTQRVHVALAVDAGHATLSVRDEGAGFDPVAVPPGSFGLAGIRERTALLGGACEILSAPGRGAEVRVSVPLPTPAQRATPAEARP